MNWKKVRCEIIRLSPQGTNHRDLRRVRHCYYKRINIPTRILHGNPRWEELEKQLRAAFEERKLGRVVRRNWLERTSARLFTEIYPHSTIVFRIRMAGSLGPFTTVKLHSVSSSGNTVGLLQQREVITDFSPAACHAA